MSRVVKSSCNLVLLFAWLFRRVHGTATVGNTPCPVFPADHVWNTPINCLPVDSNSATYINSIGSTAGLHADFGAGLCSGAPMGIPYITVPASQPKYNVTFLYADESDAGPYAIPLDAPIEGGSASTGDRHAISVDVGNCILYELYRAFPNAAGWSADSGAIFNLTNYVLRPQTWTSADAAGLPVFPGLVRYEEILKGSIDHALRFTIQNTRNTYVWPARHKASSLTGTQYPPMGQRFRLKSSFDISGFSPTNQIILRALKKYGMIVADNGSNWFLSGAPDDRWNNDDLHILQTSVFGSNFEAVDTSSLIINADSGKAKQLCNGNTAAPVPKPTQAPRKPTQAPRKPTRKPTQTPRKPTLAPRKPTQAPRKPTPAPRKPTPAPVNCLAPTKTCSVPTACCSLSCTSKRCK